MNETGSRTDSRRRFLKGAAAAMACPSAIAAAAEVHQRAAATKRAVYDPTWESLDRRPVAAWWLDAKFGVYVHWTLASVPGWGNHSSFYWPNLLKSRQMEARRR